MSIAGCVLNTKPVVKKQPSKPVFLKPKTKSYPNSGRGLVQRLRMLTSSATSDTQKRDNSHARMVPASRATSEEKTKFSDHPPVLLLGTQSVKLQHKRRFKVKPKRKVLQVAKSAAKANSSMHIVEEKRQQELFQKRTQERVASALRAKKELQTQQEQRMQEAKKSGPDPALLMKKVML